MRFARRFRVITEVVTALRWPQTNAGSNPADNEASVLRLHQAQGSQCVIWRNLNKSQIEKKEGSMKAAVISFIIKNILKFRAYKITTHDGSYTTVYTYGPMLDGFINYSEI